jgi:hypothetical protein
VTEHYEPTTYLGDGLVARDHDGWRAQVEAEKRRKMDEVIDATVAEIKRKDEERDAAPRPYLSDLVADAKVNALLHKERMAEPGRVMDEFAGLDRWALQAEAERAANPPPPDPQQKARDQANEYSHNLQAWMAHATVCGHGGCLPGACVYER